jgi:hypothetical protein
VAAGIVVPYNGALLRRCAGPRSHVRAVPSSAPRYLDNIVGLGTVPLSALRALSACAILVAISVQRTSPASRRAMCWRGRALATAWRCSSMPWVSRPGHIRFHFGHYVRPCPRPLLGVRRCRWFLINALERCTGSSGGPDIIEPRNFEDWITRVMPTISESNRVGW